MVPIMTKELTHFRVTFASFLTSIAFLKSIDLFYHGDGTQNSQYMTE